jgi:hypothetical protein
MNDEAKKTDERVRIRAYHLWERDGRPHGRNEEYWNQALAEIQAEERERASGGAQSAA